MTKNTSKLILNTDYYSTHAYAIEEPEEKMSIIKPLLLIIIIGTIVVGSTYLIKNNFTAISLWFSQVKETVLFENQAPVIIREENTNMKIKVEEIIKTLSVLTVDKVKKEEALPKIKKTKPIKDDELTDEYMKLMQNSLGKY